MGKKSRAKKEKQNSPAKNNEPAKKQMVGAEKFLVAVIRYGVCLALITPLILSNQFYFPFVGLKSLYFMGFCQVVFFAWLFLAFNYKHYRPRLNQILIALSLFLLVLLLSTVLGADVSRSFWSKFERMTGLLMWLHLFGFFLAVSSSLKSFSDWKKVFTFSAIVAFVVSAGSLLEQAGVKNLKFSGKGGLTLGNSSFLGTYLLFNIFLAFYLFWQSKNKFWKIFYVITIILALMALYFTDARAALVSTIGGFFLMALLVLGFYIQNKKIQIVGRVLLAISFVAFLVSFVLLLIPGNIIHQKFVALATQARFVNWGIGWQGFLERPVLGWGPESYDLVFTKFFNPCLFTPECGGEVWFDRAHNIIFDTLVTTGAVGFLVYLGLFICLFYILIDKYLRKKSIDFWTFGAFIVLPIAYFIQNLTVFDMGTSLMMFMLVLSFVAFLANSEGEKDEEKKFVVKHGWLSGILIVVFCFTFFEFVIQPARADHFVIKAIEAESSKTRIDFYKKTLDASPLGKYQIRDFFAEHSDGIAQSKVEEIVKDEETRRIASAELDYTFSEMDKSIKESPFDFRSVLKAAQILNIYTVFDYSKAVLAEQYSQEALKISPKNQQAYWALAQSQLYEGKMEDALVSAKKAIDLEPNWIQSYDIAVRIAGFAGNQAELKSLAQKGLEVTARERKIRDNNFDGYRAGVFFAQALGDKAKAQAIAQEAVTHNPAWAEKFKDVLGTSTTTNNK